MKIEFTTKELETLNKMLYLGRIMINYRQDPEKCDHEVEALFFRVLREELESNGQSTKNETVDMLIESIDEEVADVIEKYGVSVMPHALARVLADRDYPIKGEEKDYSLHYIATLCYERRLKEQDAIKLDLSSLDEIIQRKYEAHCNSPENMKAGGGI